MTDAPRTVDEIQAEADTRRLRRHGTKTTWPDDLVADLWRLPAAESVLALRSVREAYMYLQHLGMGQRYIAHKTGTTQSDVSGVTAGRRRVRTAELLAQIATGLGLPANAFDLDR